MIKIIEGTKIFKHNTVLDKVSLTFDPGSITGVVGENGSGKTVLLKVLAGYMSLDSGRVEQDGKLIGKNGNYIEDAGVVIEHPDFMHSYTLRENLKFIAGFCNKKIDLDYWIDFYDLREHENKKYTHLSLGTKQKMLLIQGFMHNPSIYLLDEPFNGLDRESVEKTKKLIADLRDEGKTIILASHIHNDSRDLFNRQIFIENGKIIEE